MRCADFVEPGRVLFRPAAAEPVAGEGEVLVAVEACGICGSDLHMFRNGTHSTLLTRSTPEGYRVPGHEFAGRIAAVGAGVSDWAIGERVVGATQCSPDAIKVVLRIADGSDAHPNA
ncbi:MAG: alcohol dehydrogenase catalytic domain-containing protein [Gammaproteobacteria bacterium]